MKMQKRFILKCISLFILFSNKVDEPEVVPRSWNRVIWRDESDGCGGWGEEGEKGIQPFVICFPSLISLLHNNVARMVTNRHLHSWDMHSYSFSFQFRQFWIQRLFLLFISSYFFFCWLFFFFLAHALYASRGQISIHQAKILMHLDYVWLQPALFGWLVISCQIYISQQYQV